MPKIRRSRHGSLQFWPRKRAKRVYASVNWKSLRDEKVKALGFAAYKAGMTHVICAKENKPYSIPVTILDAPPVFICGLRFYSSEKVLGETWVEKIPKGLERKLGKIKPKKKFDSDANKSIIKDVRLIACTQPEKSGIHKIKPELFELGVGGKGAEKIEQASAFLGKELGASDIFRPGEYCDVTSITKGHGFTGAVKRFGIRIQGRKDEQHHRHPGSVGSTTPRKIDWRVPMPGQYGFFQRTEYSKRIMSIDSDPKKVNPSSGWENYGIIKGNFIMIEGSVPGPRKRLIFITNTRRKARYEPADIRKITVK
jgi:large subunit ribosomal protein L3